MYMQINFTLIVMIILLVIGMRRGYQIGLVKGVANVIAILATFVTLCLIIMLTASFKEGETVNTVLTLIIMAILGSVYAIVRFALRGMKAVSNLPLIKLMNSIMGIPAGLIWTLLVVTVVFKMAYAGLIPVLSDQISKDIDASIILTILVKYNIFL